MNKDTLNKGSTIPANKSPIEELQSAHAMLLNDLQGLERMANALAATSGEELCNRLRALRADVAKHFLLEEQDGYLSPALMIEPIAQRKAHGLRGEHGNLLQALDVLIQQAAREGQRSTTLWESVKHWVDRIRQHEIRENEFFDEVGDENWCCSRD